MSNFQIDGQSPQAASGAGTEGTDEGTVAPHLVGDNKQPRPRRRRPLCGEIQLSAYEAYKLKKWSSIKEESTSKMIEKKLKERDSAKNRSSAEREFL